MTFIASPLEQFEVAPLAQLTLPLLGDVVLSLTNLGFFAALVVALVVALHLLGGANALVPTRWSVALESSFQSLHTMVKEQLGSANEAYLPFIYSVFWFVLVANLAGNVPYAFTLGTSAVVAMGLSFTVFLGVTILGLARHGQHFFSFFIPAGTPLALVPMLVPIEIISYASRAVSLGVRLFANMMAGHTLLAILSGFLWSGLTSGVLLALVTLVPLALFLALIGLELAVSVIQAYVFSILTAIYLKDAIDLH
jgi:F-type H+-transporting ATPase subunit a